ncbi:MAG: guanylate kinase [Synergistaceae bacterium]|jgi:guanylate kinase|nr:guanylate kinase [Synergistaceae bacterium]
MTYSARKEKQKGKLFVLAGPSGVGKGTLRAGALSDIDGLTYSISCTTRPPREGEREGVDYRFLSKEDFEDRAARGLFLEYAVVHGNYYGTLREDIERETAAGRDVLLEIDVQGARQIRKLLPAPDSFLIFVSPPSINVLEDRLRRRGTESEDVIRLRLETAEKEMEALSEFDRVIVNGDLERACVELRDVLLNGRVE